MSGDQSVTTTTKKALSINQDPRRYGTFAEIGAGQEVARHFFRAGLASNTIAKTMSAYDMTFSDAIYGEDRRYVSEARLNKMLDHEYDLLTQRLEKKRGEKSLFFVFANTVATSSIGRRGGVCHGWMGVRFQMREGGPSNDVIIHVGMKDPHRLQQQEVIGVLGVNVLFSALYLHRSEKEFVASLVENIGSQRIEIDIIRFRGPDLAHIEDATLNLELLSQGISKGVFFMPGSSITQASEVCYEAPLLVHRGVFRPITNMDIEIIERGVKQFKEDHSTMGWDPLVVMEILMVDGDKNFGDYLRRVEIINSLGYNALVSNLKLFYELKEYLREAAQSDLSIVVKASHLDAIFDESYYKDLSGGILSAFGRLFDNRTTLYVFPHKSEALCTTFRTFNPRKKLLSLYEHLLENEMIKDIPDKGGLDKSFQSRDVRKMLEANDPRWEGMVPREASDLIKKHQLFGYEK